MSRVLVILGMFLLTSCGQSQEEKKDIAAVTCSIMSETRNIDAVVRVREMNSAREKIGGEPFLRGDDAIIESLSYELCEELVLNDNYDESYRLRQREIDREIDEAIRELEQESIKQKEELVLNDNYDESYRLRQREIDREIDEAIRELEQESIKQKIADHERRRLQKEEIIRLEKIRKEKLENEYEQVK